MDGQRKERKKGIKRGPYRRKNKNPEGTEFLDARGSEVAVTDEPVPSPADGQPDGEWTQGSQPPAATPATTAAAMHAVAQFAPDGYYSLFYPQGPYMPPHTHEGQPSQEGTPPHPNGPHIMPYYVHPGSFPPYPYGHPGAIYPPPLQQPPTAQPPQTLNPGDVVKKSEEPVNGSAANGAANGDAPVVQKKRRGGGKTSEPKTKKAKTARNKAAAATAKEDEAPVGEGEEGDGESAPDGP